MNAFMKQIIFTCAALALASLWPLRAADTSPKKPNFVVIVADDQTYRAIGYQNPAVKTPNMDRLAGDGFRFDRAFVASPICAASRASIFTGVFPQQHGTVGLSSAGFTRSVVVEKRLATLPAALGEAGYHTALYGKSHLGAPTTFGFAEGREIGDHNDEETFAEAEKFLRREAGSGRPFCSGSRRTILICPSRPRNDSRTSTKTRTSNSIPTGASHRCGKAFSIKARRVRSFSATASIPSSRRLRRG